MINDKSSTKFPCTPLFFWGDLRIFVRKIKQNDTKPFIVMKKNLLILLAVIVSVSVSVFAFIPKSDEERLLEANVRALAQNVTIPVVGDIGTGKCYNSIKTCYTEDADGNRVIDRSRTVLYCGTCKYVYGKPAFLSGTGMCSGYGII